MKKPVGDSIREARTRKGLSQADLAKILSVSQAAVGQWERGTTAPRWKYVHVMREVFDPVFESDLELSSSDEQLAVSTDNYLDPTMPNNPVVQLVPGQHARILAAEHRGVAADFDRTLYQALLRLDPASKSHVTVGGNSELSQWVVDYMNQMMVVEVKHPDSYYGIDGFIARGLLQLTVLRSILGPERSYILVVRRPVQAPLRDVAMPGIERQISKLSTEADLLGLHLLVVSTVEEAAKAIDDLCARPPPR